MSENLLSITPEQEKKVIEMIAQMMVVDQSIEELKNMEGQPPETPTRLGSLVSVYKMAVILTNAMPNLSESQINGLLSVMALITGKATADALEKEDPERARAIRLEVARLMLSEDPERPSKRKNGHASE